MTRCRGILRTLAAVFLAALMGASASSGLAFAETPSYSVDEVEAAFLYRFAGFVSWPKGAAVPSVFTVAVLDDDTVASDLERMLPRRDLKEKPVRVRRITSIERLGDARILYIGASKDAVLKRWLAQIADRPVLVVTSQPGALDDGSMINFLVLNSHVRFEVSLAAARRSGLIISAELLSVATHIQGRPMGSEAPCQIPQPRFRQRPSCSPRLASR